VAAPLYLLLKHRRRQALVFALAVGVGLAPWAFHSRPSAATLEESFQGNVVRSYTNLFWRRVGDDSRSGTISAAGIPGRAWHSLLDIAGTRMASLLGPTTRALYRRGADVPPRQTSRMSLALSAVTVAGLAFAVHENFTLAELVVPLSIGITASWPW